MKTVVVVDGVSVYSDMSVTTTSGGRINFSDGSWCDVDSRKIHNCGSGYISFDGPSEEDTPIVGEEMTFRAEVLNLDRVFADVCVETHESNLTTVQLTGTAQDHARFKTEFSDGELRIFSDKQDLNSGSVVIQHRYIHSSTSKKGAWRRINDALFIRFPVFSEARLRNVEIRTSSAEPPKLLIRVPVGTKVICDCVRGSVVIGDILATLCVTSDSVYKVQAGRVHDALIDVSGTGNVVIASVNGARLRISTSYVGGVTISDGQVAVAEIDVSGTGNVKLNLDIHTRLDVLASSVGSVAICGRRVSTAHMNVSGTGSVKYTGSIGDAEIRTSSVGGADIEEVCGVLDARSSGTGSIRVQSGRVSQLTAKTTSVGSVKFGGCAQRATLTCSGTGSIHVDRVLNPPVENRTSVGRIRVKKIG